MERLDSVIQSLIIYEKQKKTRTLLTLFYTLQKTKIVKDEDYITENEKRRQKTKDKIKGKTTKTKQKRNPTIENINNNKIRMKNVSLEFENVSLFQNVTQISLKNAFEKCVTSV